MRTTINLSDDIVVIIKDLANRQNKSAGEVVSGLIRVALETPSDSPKSRNGIPLLTPVPGAPRPTLELINRLRDDE
jgi:hypothetical protein